MATEPDKVCFKKSAVRGAKIVGLSIIKTNTFLPRLAHQQLGSFVELELAFKSLLHVVDICT